ncbi:hypothetical protein AB0I75_31680, partial [Streptomyces sp. NPDC050273]|uniref:hypothetical protein n=1 Tax=Streptomyces sp. NPDC050273 TaxID=3154933 RepID=UPI00343A61E6
MTLMDLRDGFRDAEQRECVQAMIASRLADDREPQECRYLMRFWWQLSMPYQEVSVAELRLNVGQQKLDVVLELVRAIRSSHEEIDAWLRTPNGMTLWGRLLVVGCRRAAWGDGLRTAVASRAEGCRFGLAV